MKKLLCLLMVLMTVLPMTASAQLVTRTDLPARPLYRATMAKESKMRGEPSTSAEYLGTVPDEAVIYIYEWGEDWSLCGYNGKIGYIITNRFYELWRLGDEPLPGMVFTTGVAEMKEVFHAEETDKSSGDLFTGLDLQPGDVIAAISEKGEIPFRRTTLTLPEGSYAFTPFTAVEDAQAGDLIYAFTTYYNDAVGGDLAAERRFNIELCAERLNGHVVPAGESFSFNELCGPYTVERGYVRAPNISQSGYGVGGGVCQVSTTLFEAILGLPIKLTQWEVHQTSGVKYAPLNFDCAVGSSKDLCFTNTLPFDLRIDVRTQGGALSVYLYRN